MMLTVKLRANGQAPAADEAMTQLSDLGTGHLTPVPEGPCTQQAMVSGS